jgi:DNA-binding transcriptional MocR family regulator
LRAYFAQRLTERGVRAQASDIVLTQGASQALDLAVRALLEAGDTAVVEDPAYPPTLELLRARGVRILSIERLETGPDVVALERILETSKIRAFYTNTSLQNPTGTSTSAAVAKRLADLAKAHAFTIVEDDIFADLAPSPVKPIAAFDDAGHVIHVSSLSKTIAPTLRVGYLLANSSTLQAIMRLKALSALASSELSERIAYSTLTQSRYRRHLRQLRERLGASQKRVQSILLAHGVELAHRPVGGMFVWGRIRSPHPAGKIWQEGVDAGVLLAPGESFRADGRASPWWRFNVTQCEDHALAGFLSGRAARPV